MHTPEAPVFFTLGRLVLSCQEVTVLPLIEVSSPNVY